MVFGEFMRHHIRLVRRQIRMFRKWSNSTPSRRLGPDSVLSGKFEMIPHQPAGWKSQCLLQAYSLFAGHWIPHKGRPVVELESLSSLAKGGRQLKPLRDTSRIVRPFSGWCVEVDISTPIDQQRLKCSCQISAGFLL